MPEYYFVSAAALAVASSLPVLGRCYRSTLRYFMCKQAIGNKDALAAVEMFDRMDREKKPHKIRLIFMRRPKNPPGD